MYIKFLRVKALPAPVLQKGEKGSKYFRISIFIFFVSPKPKQKVFPFVLLILVCAVCFSSPFSPYLCTPF